MPTISVRLFGKFRVSQGDTQLHHIDAPKLQELFGYLLLFRDRPHPRETLAGHFWGNQSIARSKKYLRQALWQIQSALALSDKPDSNTLLVSDPNWVILNTSADLWVDVIEFEKAYQLSQSMPVMQIDPQNFKVLSCAAGLYQGDLLEGCYQDWCLFERERLQNMYLALLDKLMDYCEANQEYEHGLAYGTKILRYDRARERTHRRLMRIYHFSGNRTEALRQYQRCVTALKEDLDVQPSRRTIQLCEQIRSDLLEERSRENAPAKSSETPTRPLSEVLGRLNQLHRLFLKLQEEIQEDIRLVERALNGKH